MNQVIRLQKEFITLGQLLKEAGIIATGGQAKMFLQENEVKVNGEKEQRRGRKLYDKDTVHIQDVGTFTVTASN